MTNIAEKPTKCKKLVWFITWILTFDAHINLLPNEIAIWAQTFLQKNRTLGCFGGEEGKKCVFEVWSC